MTAFRQFLLASIQAEYNQELNEGLFDFFFFRAKKSLKLIILDYSDSNKNKAESELEGKRDELRSKLLADLEDKKKALEIEKLQVQSL